MSVPVCLTLLALFSLTAASNPECDELLKPLTNQTKASGKWIFHVGTADNEVFLEELKKLNSSWIEINPIPDSEEMSLRFGDKMGEKCFHGGTNFTFSENSTKATFNFNSTTRETTGYHLVTCPDCLTWIDTSVVTVGGHEIRRGRSLYLFTKTGILDDSHLDLFKKQAACSSFQPEFHFGETTDLCPAAKEEEQ